MRANPLMPNSCTLKLMWGAISERRILSLAMVNRLFPYSYGPPPLHKPVH